MQRTSAGAAAVNLKQTYRGLPVFQMSRTVRFNPAGQLVDAAGDTAAIPDEVSSEPKLGVEDAVLKGPSTWPRLGSGRSCGTSSGRKPHSRPST